MKCPRCGDDDHDGPTCSCGYEPKKKPMTTPILEEFEKAFLERSRVLNHPDVEIEAGELSAFSYSLWGAKWMAERCAKRIEDMTPEQARWIRQLAKELNEEGVR